MRRLGLGLARVGWRGLVLVAAALVVTSCGAWRGIANVPLPGGPGTGAGHMRIYVQMPDTWRHVDGTRSEHLCDAHVLHPVLGPEDAQGEPLGKRRIHD